ncbi:hypothetical protein C8Q72DRAFT_475761 [Fomitopsis betulina]|nr:hypothetical protein C8Q72DRAFT_475761 [Fomitopsis betulina]
MADMHESPSFPELPYTTECPYCRRNPIRRIRPLPPDAVLAVDPDGIDWNEYYWGYRLDASGSNRSERRNIVRPLPRSITDRIPLELFEHILDFLLWETKDLYNCALVCRAWRHHSQCLLYAHVAIEHRAAYDALGRSLRNGRSGYLARASTLYIQGSQTQSTIPLVSGRYMCSLRCLTCYSCIMPPYHSSLPLAFSGFSVLIHLTLRHFQLNSFTDLRSIICSLKSLRDLNLTHGSLLARARATDSSHFSPFKAPQLTQVTLGDLQDTLFSDLAQWFVSTEICCGCTILSLLVRDESQRPSTETILQKLGPSLDFLDYVLDYPDSWRHLGVLLCCTNLSTIGLQVCANSMDSWQGHVTALHHILSSLASHSLHTIQVYVFMCAPEPNPSDSALARPDSEFWAVDLGLIQDLLQTPVFASLQHARISICNEDGSRLTRDAVLTAEEMERRIRLILEPWSRRGILLARSYELTDEEIRRNKDTITTPSNEVPSKALAARTQSPSRTGTYLHRTRPA